MDRPALDAVFVFETGEWKPVKGRRRVQRVETVGPSQDLRDHL